MLAVNEGQFPADIKRKSTFSPILVLYRFSMAYQGTIKLVFIVPYEYLIQPDTFQSLIYLN
jgi:hypothetical protein